MSQNQSEIASSNDIGLDINIVIVDTDIDLRKEFVQSLWQNLKLGKSNMSHVFRQIGHLI